VLRDVTPSGFAPVISPEWKDAMMSCSPSGQSV
jgi:hypothetical protein